MSALSNLIEYTDEVFAICKERVPEKETLEALQEHQIAQIIFQAAFDGKTPLEAAEDIAAKANVEMR